MPAMQEVWHPQALIDYVDRWVGFGAWTQPDPCAPADGVCVGGSNNGQACNHAYDCPDGQCDAWDNYGITFGPDGSGGCILDTDPSDGIGRFPERHGIYADEGHRRSQFQAAMWDAYRHYYAISLTGTPADGAIHLQWKLQATLAPTAPWQLDYDGILGDQIPPLTIISPTHAYTLTGLTNYTWYTITLSTHINYAGWLTETVSAMPTDQFVHLPLVLK